MPTALAAPSENKSYVIPAGHFIVAVPGVSQMDPRIWDESTTWRPRRWLDQGGIATAANEQYMAGEKADYGFGLVSKGTESPYQPFGAGRHRCVGEQFAYLQLSIVIGEIVRNFKLDLATSNGKFPPTNYSSMIVLPMESMIAFTKRK